MKKRLTLLVACLFAFIASIPMNAAPATDSLDINVPKVTVKPVIDGNVSADEWGEAVMHQEPGVGLTYYPDEATNNSANGMKADIYMLWDEEGLYCAAVVEDHNHFNQHTGADIWNGDSFEFDSNFNPDDFSDRNRQTFGINNDSEVYGGSYKVATGVDWTTDDIEYSEYKAKVDGNFTYYEFFVKWENFCPTGKDFAKVGNIFRGNVQILYATDGDYIGDQRYVKYDAATDTSTFPNFILTDAASAVTEAPAASAETSAPAETSAAAAASTDTAASPQTADLTSAVIVISCLAAAAAFAVEKNKNKR